MGFYPSVEDQIKVKEESARLEKDAKAEYFDRHSKPAEETSRYFTDVVNPRRRRKNGKAGKD